MNAALLTKAWIKSGGLIFCAALSLHAALPVDTFWEIRGGSGSDNNSGCFSQVTSNGSGTDYSQQPMPQYGDTDLTVDSSDNTIVTSAAHTFVQTDKGNCLVVVSGTGWTAGVYMITQVSMMGAATLDRSPAATSTMGGTYNVGGAIATLGRLVGQATACNTAYLSSENGTIQYGLSSEVFFNFTSGTCGNPFSLIGYGVTRSDGSKATISTSTNSLRMTRINSAGFSFENLIFANTAGTPGNCMEVASTTIVVTLKKVLFDGCSRAFIQPNGDGIAFLQMREVEIKNSKDDAIELIVRGGVMLEQVWIHENAGRGLYVHGNFYPAVNVNRSVFQNNGLTKACIGATPDCPSIMITEDTSPSNNTGGLYLRNTAIIDSQGSAVWVGGNTSNCSSITIFAYNNVIERVATGYGFEFGCGPIGLDFQSNAFLSPGSGPYLRVSAGTNDINLSAEAFNNPNGGDFTLSATVGGGPLLATSGFPGVTLFGSAAVAVGPLQAAAGGGSGTACARVLLCSGN